MEILLLIWLLLALLHMGSKPDTSYKPKNVMGDGGFSSDKQVQKAKGGKLKLR